MGIFNTKSEVSAQEENKLEETDEMVSVNERPRVCCIDIEEDDENELKAKGFNIYSGTLGDKISVPNYRINEKHSILLKFDFPVNLHEYDIVIIDLNNCKTIDYKSEDNKRDDHTGKTAISLLSTYPETIFNPRPISSLILKKKLQQIGDRPHVVLVFTTSNYSVEYEPVKIHEDYVERQSIESHGIYSFDDNIPLSEPKIGKEITIHGIREDFKKLFEVLLPDTTYNQTFYHPTTWENGKNVPRSSWIPLLKNSNNEIVSICNSHKNSFIFYLPQFKDKKYFLCEFLSKIAPDLVPELFPFSTTFNWTSHKEYWLPNHASLLGQKELLKKEYELKITEIDNEITLNIETFSFLHEIITETGDKLTSALIKYFKWLGFEDVVDYDSRKSDASILEEDIQININEGLLIIECKGIGGTSTDSDCSQVSKIKHRRCKERNKFDVCALYIVNHQRYLPPLNRLNPPFTPNQIQDSLNDERGLVSTWQLYNLYFDVENGVVSKDEARSYFIRHGLLNFTPKDLVFIDEPSEVFKNGSVCIVNLDNIELRIADELIAERNGQYAKVVINGIQVDDNPVSSASLGEVGLLFNSPIKKKTKLWKKGNS